MRGYFLLSYQPSDVDLTGSEISDMTTVSPAVVFTVGWHCVLRPPDTLAVLNSSVFAVLCWAFV